MKKSDEELEAEFGHYAEVFENFPPQVATKASADLARVARARYQLEDAIKELDAAVVVAKETSTWQAIGNILGMSRQAARERFTTNRKRRKPRVEITTA